MDENKKEATHIAVPTNVVNAMLQTLRARPYAEVAEIIDAYGQTAKPIVLEESSQEPDSE